MGSDPRVYLSVCLSVLRVSDTLGPGAVFRGLPPGLPGGGGERSLPALRAARPGQALEDTMRHLWSLKQLFSVYMLLFIEEVFLQKKKKKKKKFPGKRRSLRGKEALTMWTGPLSALPR